MADTRIFNIDPTRLTLENYSISDASLINDTTTTVAFNPTTDYIEYFIYELNGDILESNYSLSSYRITDNLLVLDPEANLIENFYDVGNYNTFYNFLTNRASSSNSVRYFISEISSNRTELRLSSTSIPALQISSSVAEFTTERATDDFYPDFYLNFGDNNLLIANNIQLDGETVLIKLYEALPAQFQLNATCYVVEEVAEPLAYNVQFIQDPIVVDDTIKIKGPNYNLNLNNQLSNSTEPQDFNSLTSTNLTSSLQQINSFSQDTSIAINIDYTDYANFVNFSSAQKRVGNFFYKLQQIENWQSLADSGSAVTTTPASASTANFQSKINETINEFDTYEYYLYYSSGSVPYPKSNSTQPFDQELTTSTEAQTWITASLLSGSNYDVENVNWIYYAIPAYLREDPLNSPYIDFCDMVGHFYDENVWIYVKDITNKWDNDNRIDSGISTDLIAQQLRDLGFNLYENQFSSNDLFTSILGLTPSGSSFPFPYMTGSLPTPSGYEYINNFVTGSNEILPQDLVNKRLYKRIYNALPYLYKKKGTVDGLRALATIYGIPDTLLQINEFGSKDKDNTNDYDFWFNQFNYKYDAGTVTTDWTLNTEWLAQSDTPKTVEFRFKAPSLQSAIDTPKQALWVKDTTAIVLDYTGSGYTSGSYSGSTPDPYNEYAHLIFTADNFATTASVYLPFFDSGWWSTAVTYDTVQEIFTLSAANNIYSGADGSQLGFNASSSVSSAGSDWDVVGAGSIFPSSIDVYSRFSGSYQEIRYYTVPLNSQSFFDYTMNPQSIEGNGINSGSSELAFRASLGGELYTGSTSIHPKVTGSWTPIPSFAGDSNFTINDGAFTTNTGYVFMDQPAVGIKNRISDKIRSVGLQLPEGNQQLSNIRSIQQDNNSSSGSYTDTVNLLEVALSPTNQINDDIIDSLGYFNIGEYIGDPRLNLTSSNTYPNLVELSNDYFLKYTGNYDWNDFIRLIGFFDNSLFKLIKDFTPAKVSVAAGITIKQHLLERNKYPEPQVSRSEHEYTGSIGQIAGLLDGQRIYTASSAFESFPLYTFTGSDGGTLPDLTVDYDNSFGYTTTNIINVTQSWSGSHMTPFGAEAFTDDSAKEYFDGEFSGSDLVVTTQSLNPDCDPFKKPNTTIIEYNVISLTNNNDGSGTQRPFEFFLNPPAPQFGTNGDIVLWWNAKSNGIGETYNNAWEYNIEAIKIFKEDANGLDLENDLAELKQIILKTDTFTFGPIASPGNYVSTTVTSTIECNVLQIAEYPDFYLYYITPTGVISFESDLISPLALPVVEQTSILSVLTPLVPSTFFLSDCNPLYGNILTPRQSNIFWDLDYTVNAAIPTNQQVIISASQQFTNYPKAFVQDYNYQSTGILRSRYYGAKSSAPGFNLPATEGGFGGLPVVESEGMYFAYFNWVGGTSPEWGNNLEDISAVNIRYYIDENGSIIEPINDNSGINLSIVQQNFEQDSNSILSFNDTEAASVKFSNLEGLNSIFKSGQRVDPIIYTQTASIGSDLTATNLGGGCAPEIDFVQGDQAGQSITDFTLKAYSDGSGWSTAIDPNFSNVVAIGGGVTFPSGEVYTIGGTSPQGPPITTLNFDAVIYRDGAQNKGVEFQWYKGATAVGSPVVWDVSNDASITVSLPNISDAAAANTYQLKINSIGPPPGSGIIDPGPLEITTASFINVTQSPSTNLGPVNRFWTRTSPAGLLDNQIAARATSGTDIGLKAVYGQRQTDITNSGFNPITQNFTVEVGDEIRFQGTETQTYYISNVDTTGGDVILTLDRNITLTSVGDLSYFLLRRYVNDPSYILLNVDKPAGGTSEGILTPEYFYEGTADKVDSILKTLKTERLI